MVIESLRKARRLFYRNFGYYCLLAIPFLAWFSVFPILASFRGGVDLSAIGLLSWTKDYLFDFFHLGMFGGAVIYSYLQHTKARSANYRDAFRICIRNILKLLGVVIVQGIPLGLAAAFYGLSLRLIVYLFNYELPEMASQLIRMLATIIYAWYLSRFILAPYAVVLEKVTVFQALEKSWFIMRGRVLSLMMFPALILLPIALIMGFTTILSTLYSRLAALAILSCVNYIQVLVEMFTGFWVFNYYWKLKGTYRVKLKDND